MALDLNKQIEFKKKAPRASAKRGINLARDEEKRSKQLNGAVIAAAILIATALITKFGVMNLLTGRNAAKADYDKTHAQYSTIETELEEYDKVLLEYRAYSRVWMEKDDTGRYVSVARTKVLDMVEKDLMRKGDVRAVNILGDAVSVEVYGMNLTELSAMCNEIEENPFVAYATVQTARLDEKYDEEGNATTYGNDMYSSMVMIRLRPESKEG